MKILVIRFRQMGDAILGTALLNAIKRNFPDAEVHYVLNSNIAKLFEGHECIDKIISFTPEERKSSWKYLKKVRSLMKHERYDAIIDMRSTLNTLPFTLFSLRSKYRIGLDKSYTKTLFNYRFPKCRDMYMGDHNTRLLSPLANGKDLDLKPCISLNVTDEEVARYREYMLGMGIDFSKPVMLCGVVAKDDDKNWNSDRMAEVLQKVRDEYPTLQMVFNYAPGREEEKARAIYQQMGAPDNVFIDMQAKSMRELMCLAKMSTLYFGNEGGARHIVEAMGTPSLVIGSPGISKGVWIKESDTASCITVSDIDPDYDPEITDYAEAYNKITVSEVWHRLLPFLQNHL